MDYATTRIAFSKYFWQNQDFEGFLFHPHSSVLLVSQLKSCLLPGDLSFSFEPGNCLWSCAWLSPVTLGLPLWYPLLGQASQLCVPFQYNQCQLNAWAAPACRMQKCWWPSCVTMLLEHTLRVTPLCPAPTLWNRLGEESRCLGNSKSLRVQLLLSPEHSCLCTYPDQGLLNLKLI